jgi:hypothetical protein
LGYKNDLGWMDAVTLHTLTRMITAINVAYGMLSATCS